MLTDARFHSLLVQNFAAEDRNREIFSALKEMSISQADFEIRSISLVTEEGIKALGGLLDAIVREISSRRNYELAITYLNVALRAHVGRIRDGCLVSLRPRFEAALNAISEAWSESLEPSIHHSLCLINLIHHRI